MRLIVEYYCGLLEVQLDLEQCCANFNKKVRNFYRKVNMDLHKTVILLYISVIYYDITVLSIFHQINTSLVSIRDLLQYTYLQYVV